MPAEEVPCRGGERQVVDNPERLPAGKATGETPSEVASEVLSGLRGHVLLVVFLAIVAGCAPGRFSGFESKVLKSDKTYLVEVTGDFCPMCRVSEDEVDAFEEVEEHKGSNVRVFRVRIEKCDRELRRWLEDHGFYDDVPFYIVVKDGKVVFSRTGAFFSLKEVEKFVKEGKIR